MTNPLSEASPFSLDELMSRWPITDETLDQMITVLRKARAQWAIDEAAGATRAKAEPKAKKSKGTISLDDLGDLNV